MTYFTYVHARPNTTDTSGIFYVGKGRRARITPSVAQRRNPHHQNIVNKYGEQNILVGKFECSTEDIAYELEQGLIKCLRRNNVNLVNLTNGGSGTKGFNMPEHCSGANHPMKRSENRLKVSGDKSATKRESVRKKLSEARKLRVTKDSTRKILSEIMRDRYSDAAKREVVSVAVKGRKRMNDGITEKNVRPEEIDVYLSNGWEFGRIAFKRSAPTQETREKISNANKGKTAHNKGKASPFKGKKRSDDVCNSIANARKGGKWITDGMTERYTHDDVLPEGWHYGRVISKCV